MKMAPPKWLEWLTNRSKVARLEAEVRALRSNNARLEAANRELAERIPQIANRLASMSVTRRTPMIYRVALDFDASLVWGALQAGADETVISYMGLYYGSRIAAGLRNLNHLRECAR